MEAQPGRPGSPLDSKNRTTHTSPVLQVMSNPRRRIKIGSCSGRTSRLKSGAPSHSMKTTALILLALSLLLFRSSIASANQTTNQLANRVTIHFVDPTKFTDVGERRQTDAG